MKRSEYERFVKIARTGEFKDPYFWQDHITDPSFLGGPGRLQNLNTTAFSRTITNEKNGTIKDRLGIYIDVFPLDNIPDDDDVKQQWKNTISKVARKAWNLRMFNSRGLLQDSLDLEWLDFWFNLNGNPNALFEKYYDLLSSNAEQDTEKCCIYSFYCRNIGHWVYKNADWKGKVMLPFEMLKVPVPEGYENILVETYGDWRTPVKGASMHDLLDNGIYFDTEHPYIDLYNQDGILDKDKVRRILKKTVTM